MKNLSMTTLRRYPKTLGSIGILTTCGLIFYNKRGIQKFISKILNKSNNQNDKAPGPDYIYIKYHIYKESMRKLKQKEENDKKWISVIVNPIGKWWKAVKHSVAWRLLNIAQTGSHHERLKAVRQLARIDHLKDWDFRHLAQICDARTAVSLARSGADTRWFIPVHKKGCIKNPKLVLSELHNLLERLKSRPCVKHFFEKHFPQQDPVEDVCEFFTPEQPISFNVQETDMLKEIISFLQHITKEPDAAEQIIKDGGLVHLMELCKIFANDNETLSTLCKVLANMSVIEDVVDQFFFSGWIGVLAEWQQSPDLRLQVISSKTMANLDHDDPNYTVYSPNVYPLHPRFRTRSKPKADIVFVHGLMGGVFITWRQKDRKRTELGLYGKNAFYTSETDDVFLVGEQKRIQLKKNCNGNGIKNEKVNSRTHINQNSKDKDPLEEAKVDGNKEGSIKKDALLKATTKHSNKPLQISDDATKELVERLQNEAELDPDWEVVHPDIPLAANESCSGEFSIAGNKWLNQDIEEEYTNCWPMEWLPEDHPNTRIIGIDYKSALTEWSVNFTKYCPCEKGQGHIDVRASSLLERLEKADVGHDRPVVWIGHSMGGILTKIILMKAKDSADQKTQKIAANTNGIVFLGVPHRGSPIAKWKQHMQMILSPSIEVKEMEEGAPKLLELHERFMNCLNTYFRHVKVVSVAEGSPTMLTSFKFPLRIVTEESACINHGDFYVLKDDHLSLSKPIFRQSFLYQRLLQIIDETVNNNVNRDLKQQLQAEKCDTQSLKSSTQNSSLIKQTKNILSLLPQFFFKFSST